MLYAVLLLALLVLWTALYFAVLRKKLLSFQYTAGFMKKIDAAETGLWERIVLSLKGFKVLILGIITSAVPLVGPLFDQINGLDWTKFFPDEKAKIIAIIVTMAGIIGPMIMVMLHTAGIEEAAKIEPKV